MLSAVLFAACLIVPYRGDVGSSPAVKGTEPVSFARLEERVDLLLGETTDADRRDRLLEDRELMVAMRAQDPLAQRRVYAYLDKVISIEERARTVGILPPDATEPIIVPIVEEVLEVGPAVDPRARVSDARAALASFRYVDAIAALEKIDDPEAIALRKEAIDGYAAAARERAGHDFLAARDMEAGSARVAALQSVRQALVLVNTRFPENTFSSQIAEHIAKVDAELK